MGDKRGSSGQRKPSSKGSQQSEGIGPCVWEWVPRRHGRTPTVSATNVKGPSLKTGLKVVLFPKIGKTRGKVSKSKQKRLEEQLERYEGSRKLGVIRRDILKCPVNT